MLIVTIVQPNWPEVEKVIIFLISFWVRVHVAVTRAVRAPKHSAVV